MRRRFMRWLRGFVQRSTPFYVCWYQEANDGVWWAQFYIRGECVREFSAPTDELLLMRVAEQFDGGAAERERNAIVRKMVELQDHHGKLSTEFLEQIDEIERLRAENEKIRAGEALG